MQAFMETVFDLFYLTTVITMGIWMIKNAKGNRQFILFGIMAVLLGCGDAFHLIPRAYALWTTGLEANAIALGVGKFITSITMTIFYVILYYIWKIRYHINGRNTLTHSVFVLAILRIVLCLFPQNEWLNYSQPLHWAIYRNIPFAMLGIMIIILFYQEVKKCNDTNFKYMWLAIVLSFAFYVPVVLVSDQFPIIGVLMIPKTLAYVWIVFMGFKEVKNK